MASTSANTSDNKTVSFSDTLEHFISEKENESDEKNESDEEKESEEENEYPEDYVESVSEGEYWSSSDEDHLELFDKILEGARFGSSRKVEPVQRNSLLLFDKDILNEEDEEYDDSSVYSEISSCCSGMLCGTSQSSQSEGEQSDVPSKLSKSVLKGVQVEPSSSKSPEPTRKRKRKGKKSGSPEKKSKTSRESTKKNKKQDDWLVQ